MPEIPVSNGELRTIREAMREMSSLLDLLDEGVLAKVVLTSKGQLRGVLLSVDEYAKLTSES